jgi:RHS repeat-associated protein
MIDRQQMLKIAFHAGLLSLSIALTLGAQQPTWSSGTYVYDNNGNIAAIGTDTFAYDAANRLLSGTAGPGRNQMYRYDAFGNLTQIVTDGQVTLIPGVDPATNQITVPVGQTAASGLVVTATGQYDSAGNMTGFQNGLYTFAYDGLNMLKDYQGGGRREIYIYTPDNERIAVATVSGSGANATVNSTRWTIRGLDHKVLREFDDANPSGGHLWSWKEDWIYANGQLIAAENDQPDHTLHFFSDHLGTPRLITGSGGAVIARHTYYPFGEEATSPAQDAEVMKFTGHERDSLLDYMHARFTDAALGRFLSVDPKLDDDTPNSPRKWNRYSYVENNPLRYADPDGRSRWDTFNGYFNALFSDYLLTVRRDDGNADYKRGQLNGDRAAVTTGGIFATTGTIGGVVTSPTGVGAVAGGTVAVAGVVGGINGSIHLAQDENPRSGESDNKSRDKAINSLEQRIEEHKQKLEAYKASPDAFDNKGLLKNAPNAEVRQRIIDGRIRHLEQEIKTFEDQVTALRKE